MLRDEPSPFSLKHMKPPPFIKVLGGITYTIDKRLPSTDPPVYYWRSDSGNELVVTWEETLRYGLYPDQN